MTLIVEGETRQSEDLGEGRQGRQVMPTAEGVTIQSGD